MKINQLLLSTFLISVLLAACSGPAPSTPAVPMTEAPVETQSVVASEASTAGADVGQAAIPVLSVDQLKNATYSGIYDEPITLANGLYEGQPYMEGDPSHPIVEYIDGTELYGDLDRDGVEDAIVFLLDRGGGSGAFTYVAALLNRDGQPLDAGAVMIEDRIGVKSSLLQDGQVRMEIITQGPGDAACCGSHKVNKVYALQDGRLAELTGTSENIGQLSAADLNGTSWTLSELNQNNPALPDVDVTINFQDGQINGSGGCNHYNGTFSLGSESPLLMTIGPLTSTKKACSETISTQETSYLTALENVTRWGYVFGRLALYYQTDTEEPGRLLFDPAPAPAASQESTLAGRTWQWVSFTDPVEKIDIESPENYTLTFNEDGTLSIKADCNVATANYTDNAGSIQIRVGPATLAQCPADSRSDELIQHLGDAARYFVQDGHLFIDLMVDGGTMEFTPAD